MSDRRENDANFSGRNSANKNYAQNSPKRGDDIIVPKCRKTVIEMKI